VSSKLYIGNLPFETTADHLFDLFNTCGKVLHVHVPLDRDTHRPRGFAFIQMETPEAATNATNQLDGAMIAGRNIKISPAMEKPIKTSPAMEKPIKTSPAMEKPIKTSPLTNKPYAKKINDGECILCGVTNPLYGFNPDTGVCSSCIYSLSKASRSSKMF